jgi:hypothetical protein
MIAQSPAVPEYYRFVYQAVNDAAPAAATFADLLAALPGIGPIEAVKALTQNRASPHSTRLLANARTPESPVLPFDQGADLPLPHPLDMEWRFTASTVQALLQQAIDETADGDAILLLGVPSVAAAARRTCVDRQFLITGEGNVICEALQYATTDDPRFLVSRRLRGNALDMQRAMRNRSNYIASAAAIGGPSLGKRRSSIHVASRGHGGV